MSSAVPPKSPRSSRKTRPPGIALQVDPADQELRFLTWRDWLYEIRISGSTGILVSLALHVIVLVVLAWLVIDLPGRTEVEPYLLSWLDPNEIPPTTVASTVRRPVALPLSMPVTTEPTPQTSKAEAKPLAVVQPRGVKVADTSGTLRQRDVAVRGDAAEIERLGGSAAAQRAIKSGLAWLVRQQTSDGRWELHQGYPDAGTPVIKTDTGATALSLLALLGGGQTPYDGDHKDAVKRGLHWLVDIQDPVTGDLHDQRQEEGRQAAFYAHAMGTIALCEALALTRDESLREPATKAVKYLLDSQHPENGGWKYRPISRLMVGDLSVTGWALMALHTARMADINVPLVEFERASGFLDSVSVQGGARYKYEPQDATSRFTPALTAEGLLCRQWFGWPRDEPALQDGLAYLLDDKQRPEWSAGRRNVYAWYYTAQVLHNLGGENWQTWYPIVRELVVKHQSASGSGKGANDVRGSWHPTQPPGAGEEYGDKAGRLYVTAMCLLILETPYRHRPIYDH